MSEKIIVSGVAVGQWKEITSKGRKYSKDEIEDKIKRAIILGKPVHIYKSGDYIIKYYDINILLSASGIVLTVWKHNCQKTYIAVDEVAKRVLLSGVLNVEMTAYAKHELVLNGEYKVGV